MSGGINRREQGLLITIVFLLVVWFEIIPVILSMIHPGQSSAKDFVVFYSAAQLLAHHGNPYNLGAIVKVEKLVLPRPFPVALTLANYPYMPIVAALFLPFIHLSFNVAYYYFVIVSFLLICLSIYFLCKILGWQNKVIISVFAPLTMISLWGLLVGQVDAILLAILTAVIYLRVKNYALLAGILVALSFLKPQLFLLLAPILIISFYPDLKKMLYSLIGFISGALALLIYQYLAYPHLLASWWQYDTKFVNLVPQIENGLTGLIGTFPYLPRDLHISMATNSVPVLLLSILGIVLVVATCVILVSRSAKSRTVEQTVLLITFPLAIWLLFTPYSHLNDLLLLFPLIMLIIGKNGANLRHFLVWLFLLILIFTPYVEVKLIFLPNFLPGVSLLVCLVGLIMAKIAFKKVNIKQI